MRFTLVFGFVFLLQVAGLGTLAKADNCAIRLLPISGETYRAGTHLSAYHQEMITDRGYKMTNQSTTKMIPSVRCYFSFVGEACVGEIRIMRMGRELLKVQTKAILKGYGGIQFAEAIVNLPECTQTADY